MRDILDGKELKISPIDETDEIVLKQWFNDGEFLRYYDFLPAIVSNNSAVKDVLNYYENTNERYIFGIRDKKEDQLLGVIGFDNIVWTSGTAFMFIGIGNKHNQGKGLGTQAINMLLDYGFNEFNFHKIQLNVLQYNERAIKLYEKVGFVKEGTYREYVYRDGIRYDMYLYGMLKSEWKNHIN
ncbi:GNAT family N-acetyltransferase [Clostridium oryzae]|uniref:Putative ribosomal N-acetyltransferase YdaF n=1 Tax=Clostridium oryzae TaxID=1450648 RepID=A0A1V4IYN3_9CLOT|nr:GNAT family protein [Clostridium oryzae]OPJ65003.1 putative ribosomal N-acetyltransferase YdaF [Clostridium oryzae]